MYYELDATNIQKNNPFAQIIEYEDDNEQNEEWVETDNIVDNQNSISSEETFEVGDWETDIEWMEETFESKDEQDKTNTNEPTVELNEKTLTECIKFINCVTELMKYNIIGKHIVEKLHELSNQKKLEEFYSNETFSVNFDKLMEHDKTKDSYYFHGTQCLEDAETIANEGLGMMRSDLTTTAYKEFSKDEVILYERGWGGEIGRHAIVIIDVPKDVDGSEINIVMPLTDASNINFNPSGLQGLNGKANYIVPSENIVGYVDKLNKKIIFNPRYKNYDQFAEQTNHRTI